jgi:hypothetical protein
MLEAFLNLTLDGGEELDHAPADLFQCYEPAARIDWCASESVRTRSAAACV